MKIDKFTSYAVFISVLATIVLIGLMLPAQAVEQFMTPGQVMNYSSKRINLSNTGSYPSTSDIVWQGDANRWFRQKNIYLPGNDSSFVFESDITSFGSNFTPAHGGVWSILDTRGDNANAPGFALMASGHRYGRADMYGVHSECWDKSATDGACILFNAEAAQLPSVTRQGSKYLGYNMQVGATAKNALGIQFQSNPGSYPDNYYSLFTGTANTRYGLDFTNVHIAPGGAVFKFGPSQIGIEGPNHFIRAMVGDRVVKIPFYY